MVVGNYIMKDIKELLIPAGRMDLSKFDPDDTFGKTRDELDNKLPKLKSIMSELQYNSMLKMKNHF